MRRLKELTLLAWRVSTLGSGPLARARILLVGLLLPVKKRVPGLRARRATLRLRRFDRDFDFVVVDRPDFVILQEVFFEGAYETALSFEPRVIVDLGSNVGASVVYFALRHPGCRIVAVEPSPVAYDRLLRNVRALPGVQTIRSAVAAGDGTVPFFVSDEGLSSSLSSSAVGKIGLPYRHVEVEAKTLGTLLDEAGVKRVDLLKLDIEGAEEHVLRSPYALARVEAIVGELHVDLIEASKEEMLACLDEFTVSARPDPMPDVRGADRWRFEATRPARAGEKRDAMSTPASTLK